MDKILFGSDPEGFYSTFNGLGGIKVVPPAVYRFDHKFPVVEKDPKHPVFRVADGENGVIKLIEDGAAFELTVPPSENMKTLYQDIQIGYQLASEVAREFGNFITITPAIPFDTNEFKNRKRLFNQCLIFGCDPDNDIYEMQGLIDERPMEEKALDHPWRYGGGHIHISGIEFFQKKPLLAVKMLATFVGNLVTFRSPMKHEDHIRTYRYGRPGRFRIQDYGKKFNNMDWTNQGIEYRTPSNAWTTDTGLTDLIEMTIRTIAESVLPDDKLMQCLVDDLEDRTVRAVMEGIPELAEQNYKDAMSMI